MFAVPGWSLAVSAPKTQVERIQKPTQSPESSTNPPKKRKRKTRQQTVTTENVVDLWEKHIEGGSAEKAKEGKETPTASKLEKKKRKREEEASQVTSDPQNILDLGAIGKKQDIEGKADTVDDGNQEKDIARKKKKKGKKDKKEPAIDPHKVKPISNEAQSTSLAISSSIKAPAPPPVSNLTPLQSKMREKLLSSRFRQLNETLYTTPSAEALDLFTKNPDYFQEYHEGFRRQVVAWPENPVDGFVRWIRERGAVGNLSHGLKSQKAQFRKHKGKGAKQGADQPPATEPQSLGIEPLPRNFRTGLCTIADLGCGDAKLAQILTSSPPSPSSTKALNLRIHSFDLAAPSPLITVADIKSLPLADSSVDVAIFSLALMGTNWIDFIEEAYRVLRWKGECWIGEVNSRFAGVKSRRVQHSVGNRTKEGNSKKGKGEKGKRAEEDVNEEENFATIEESSARPQGSTDVSGFVDVLRKRGFELMGEPELGNKMFVRMRFLKSLPPVRGKGVANDPSAGWDRKKKFIQNESTEEISVEDEGKILKPCVYKVR